MTASIHNPIPITAIAPPRPRRWTRDEYHRIAEIGLLDGQRVELIDGEITEMSPQGNSHYITIALVERALARAFGPAYWVRTQGPLSLFSHSEPEPDVAVIHGDPRGVQSHPSSAEIVVEVSDTSLALDLGAKARLYARAGITDYWVVDLQARRLIVHRQPATDSGSPGAYRYADIRTLGPTDNIAPLSVPGANISIAELLP